MSSQPQTEYALLNSETVHDGKPNAKRLEAVHIGFAHHAVSCQCKSSINCGVHNRDVTRTLSFFSILIIFLIRLQWRDCSGMSVRTERFPGATMERNAEHNFLSPPFLTDFLHKIKCDNPVLLIPEIWSSARILYLFTTFVHFRLLYWSFSNNLVNKNLDLAGGFR